MSDAPAHRVFISCVSDEFEKAAAPFPGFRGQLRHYLTRADCEVKVQEDFCQTGDVDTVEKLDRYIRKCAAVIHLVGAATGSIADRKAVADYLAAEPRFLEKYPVLRAALGGCSDLTYTQWEAFLALHHGVPLFVYATDKAPAQQQHLDRLLLARKYGAPIKNDSDLLGQLIGDIHSIIASVPKFTRKIAPSRILRHAPKILFGREPWLDALDAAWANPTLNVYTLVAWGGVGKTSLVAHWVSTRLAAKGWPGVERYFDWSFYSQGTGESRQTSSDLFIQEALKFFGDPDPIKGSPWERGERLAGLIRQHRTLLVLDGIEPLQYPPTDRSGQAGRLKDQGLEALVHGLAQDNPGLCIITTREHLTNIESSASHSEQKLDKLMLKAAIALLRHLQLIGTDEEIEKMWDALDGHALSIMQLGRLLVRAYGKDVRKWREIGFRKADKLKQGRSTLRVMQHYEGWMQSAGKEQQLELAILRLMGLFDRPMEAGCFRALRQPPAIAGLTELFQEAETFEIEAAITTLIENDLLSHGTDDAAAIGQHLEKPLDAHPLIREYFAEQLRKTQPAAFEEANSRLFDYLCENTPEQPDTLDGLQPLYEAVVHGCLAGRQQEARDEVYCDRILRGTGSGGNYSTYNLGAIGADLAAVAAFFDEPWSRVSANLTEGAQAWLLSAAAISLQALGRLTEALQPTRAGLEMDTGQERWRNAAIAASNLSQLEVTLGRLPDAVADARQSIVHADQSGDAFQRIARHATAADALHQCGQRTEASTLFAEAERIQKEEQPEYDLLYSLRGFRYSDLLLAPAERAAWLAVLGFMARPFAVAEPDGQDNHWTACDEVERRGRKMFHWRLPSDHLLDIALDHLTLARVSLIRAILVHPLPQPTLEIEHVAAAVNGLRNAGRADYLPRGLLTAALYRFVRGETEAARSALVQAQEIAERGPMPLFLAEVHLHRARMFRDRDELAKAAKLIRELGYGRRDDELADAEAALAGD